MLKSPSQGLKNATTFMSIICLLLPCFSMVSNAQDLPDPIFTSQSGVQNIYWAANGETLFLQQYRGLSSSDINATSEFGPWFTYHINEHANWTVAENHDRPQTLQSISSRFSFPLKPFQARENKVFSSHHLTIAMLPMQLNAP